MSLLSKVLETVTSAALSKESKDFVKINDTKPEIKNLKDFMLDYMDAYDYPLDELCIVGIRDKSNFKDDVINDYLGYLTKDELFLCKGTCDPGVYFYTNPMNKKGVFHIRNGFQKNVWCFGTHGGYEALVNNSKYCLPIEGIRDSNFDYKIDETDLQVRGYFGVNFHRMLLNGLMKKIGNFSAGCQVVWNNIDFLNILKACKNTNKYKSPGKALYSYMLFDIDEIPVDLRPKV